MGRLWTTVKITEAQQALIKKLIVDHPEFGYKSVGDFVAEAIRLRMGELRKEINEEKEKVPLAEE
jgi:hypothetical protein